MQYVRDEITLIVLKFFFRKRRIQNYGKLRRHIALFCVKPLGEKRKRNS